MDLLAGAADGVLAGLPAVQRRAVEVALLRQDAGEGGVNRLALSTGVLVELASEAVEAASNEPVLRAELELDLVFYLTMQSKGPEALAHAGVAVLLAEAAGLDAIVAEGLAVMQM